MSSLNSFLWGMTLARSAHAAEAVSGNETARELGARQAERAARAVERFEQRIDRLALLSMALWSLLKEHTDLTEDDLLERVRQIDLTDGKEDGKAKKRVAKCPKCGRTMSPRHGRCLYCGAEDLDYTPFDAIR